MQNGEQRPGSQYVFINDGTMTFSVAFSLFLVIMWLVQKSLVALYPHDVSLIVWLSTHAIRLRIRIGLPKPHQARSGHIL